MKLKTVHYDANKLIKGSEELEAFKESISDKNVLYLFFKDNECFYIGETSCTLKDRCYKNSKKHHEQEWFKECNTIHIIVLDDNIDDIARGTLESTFILAYRPKYNKKA
ncbi:TPA: hypothetical protein ACF0PM_002222 [Clostridium perfringens]